MEDSVVDTEIFGGAGPLERTGLSVWSVCWPLSTQRNFHITNAYKTVPDSHEETSILPGPDSFVPGTGSNDNGYNKKTISAGRMTADYEWENPQSAPTCGTGGRDHLVRTIVNPNPLSAASLADEKVGDDVDRTLCDYFPTKCRKLNDLLYVGGSVMDWFHNQFVDIPSVLLMLKEVSIIHASLRIPSIMPHSLPQSVPPSIHQIPSNEPPWHGDYSI